MTCVTDKAMWAGRLAVVDDNEDLLHMIKQSFRAAGYDFEIDIFSKSTEFIKAHEEKPYDGVLLDYTINGIEQKELIYRIDRANRATNIILMSGHFEKENESNVVLAKPFDDVVNQVMKRLTYLSRKLPFTKEVILSVVLGCLREVVNV